MYEVVDCSSWQVYEGNAAGSGRSEKRWLVSPDGQIVLFKFPKLDPSSRMTTYEHVAEHLAHQLGNLLDVKTARVDIGTYDGRLGSISYLLVNEGEVLVEGVQLILGRHPEYDVDQLYDAAAGEYYSIRHILETFPYEPFVSHWIRMLLFDFLIGNRDRHQSNWAYILTPSSVRERGDFEVRPCPLYDNGSSLCCYVREDQIRDYLGKDRLRFTSLVDTKSRSIVRIDPHSKKQPTHAAVVRYLLENYPQTTSMARQFVETMRNTDLYQLLNDYENELVSEDRKKLIVAFLLGKTTILDNLLLELRHE